MRTVILAVVLGLLCPPPAQACSIALGTPGLLALNQTGTMLTSDLLPGAPAVLTVSVPSLTSAVIEVGAPQRVQSPGDYRAAGEAVQVSYLATSLLAGQLANQPYIAATTSFPSGPPLLGALAITVTINNRIVNPGGFASGTYGTRTIVTCHP